MGFKKSQLPLGKAKKFSMTAAYRRGMYDASAGLDSDNPYKREQKQYSQYNNGYNSYVRANAKKAIL